MPIPYPPRPPLPKGPAEVTAYLAWMDECDRVREMWMRALPKVRKCDYGVVKVIDGAHRGRLGFYDDDEPDGAVVYPGEPCVGDYWIVPRRDLRIPPAPAVRRWLYKLGKVEAIAPFLRSEEVPRDFARRSPMVRRRRFKVIDGHKPKS